MISYEAKKRVPYESLTSFSTKLPQQLQFLSIRYTVRKHVKNRIELLILK